MNADRRTRLLHLSNARAAAGNKTLPQHLRDQAQKAADHLDLSLSLEDALNQKNQPQVPLNAAVQTLAPNAPLKNQPQLEAQPEAPTTSEQQTPSQEPPLGAKSALSASATDTET
jgi:hypothetical protein